MSTRLWGRCVCGPWLAGLLAGLWAAPGICQTAPAAGPDPLAGISGVFDSLPAEGAMRPLVCIIATKHPDSVKKAIAEAPGKGYMQYLWKTGAIATDLTGLPCICVHYAQLPGGSLDGRGIKAVIVTALDRRISAECTERLLQTIRETTVPMIGFCGGHHLIAMAYGSKIGNLRKLAEGEKDPNPAYFPGQFKEWGFLPVRILERHPLFDGLGDEAIVSEMHACLVTQLGPDLRNLAATDECPVQAFCHQSKLAFGTQFHAENCDEDHPDGRTIIRNFFGIAGLLAPGK